QCVGGLCVEPGGSCPVHADYVAVGVGARHVCALTEHHEMFCWGDNGLGQLGLGDNTGDNALVAVPTQVRDPASWTALAVGAEHTCGVHDGRVYCWGRDVEGQVSGAPGGVVTAPMKVAFSGMPPPIEQLAAGNDHTCALGAGTLWCWGAPDHLGLGNVTPSDATQLSGTDWVTVAAAGTHTCGIATDGSVRCWGDNSYVELGSGNTAGQSPATVPGLPIDRVAIQIAVGDYVSCAILAPLGGIAGEPWCWGRNDVGQIGNVAGTPAPPVAIDAGNASWTSITIGGFSNNNEQRLCGIIGG